jgi:hypothetical protein
MRPLSAVICCGRIALRHFAYHAGHISGLSAVFRMVFALGDLLHSVYFTHRKLVDDV